MELIWLAICEFIMQFTFWICAVHTKRDLRRKIRAMKCRQRIMREEMQLELLKKYIYIGQFLFNILKIKI